MSELTRGKRKGPHYRVMAKRRDSQGPGQKVGVAWDKDYGISIQLDPFVVLEGRDSLPATPFGPSSQSDDDDGDTPF